MKRIFAALLAITVMVSCKTKQDDTKVLSASQEAEFSGFQKWKEEKAAAAKAEMPSKPAPVVEVSNTTPAPVAAPVPVKRKGWSKAAKGAAIGAGTGVVAGAIINKKNRVAGAVIGGVIGGGVGYGIGRGQDKKDGRY